MQFNESNGVTLANCKDNEKLIAAAPDLLAALRECITDSGCQAIVSCDVGYMIRRFRAINAIAQEAIDKATK